MQAEVINRRLVKFIWAALIFFAWTIIQGAVQVQDPVRTLLDQGPGGMIGGAHTHIGLMGWMSLALMAVFSGCPKSLLPSLRVFFLRGNGTRISAGYS